MRYEDVDYPPGPIDRLAILLHRSGALLLVALAVLITYDVVSRAAFNTPFAPTTELARNAVVVIAFLQLPYSVAARALLRVTAITSLLPWRASVVLEFFGYVIGLSIFGVLIFHDTPVMIESFKTGAYEGSNAFRMPIAPVRLLAIVLWLITATVVVRHAWRILFGKRPINTTDATADISKDNQS
jgi:TRAP-type C4-dicarboxylate transport system permease small subunit